MKVIQRFTTAMIDAPIKKKMSLISSLVAGGVGVMVLLFTIVLLTQLISDNKIGTSSDFTQSLLEAKGYGLEARRSEKDFLLRRDAAYLDKVDKALSQAGKAFVLPELQRRRYQVKHVVGLITMRGNRRQAHRMVDRPGLQMSVV